MYVHTSGVGTSVQALYRIPVLPLNARGSARYNVEGECNVWKSVGGGPFSYVTKWRYAWKKRGGGMPWQIGCLKQRALERAGAAPTGGEA